MLTHEIISAIKRTFSRGKFVKEYRANRILKGVKGIRGGKMVVCKHCGKPTPSYKAEVDHIDPICPLMIAQKVMSFIMLYERTFCAESNLQLLCPDCHKIKSKKEMGQRVKWRKKKKYLVCRHRSGVRMCVIPIIVVKELDEQWEVVAVYPKRKDADNEMRRRKKL